MAKSGLAGINRQKRREEAALKKLEKKVDLKKAKDAAKKEVESLRKKRQDLQKKLK